MSIFDSLRGKADRSSDEPDRFAIGKSIGDDVRAIDLDAIGTTEEDGFNVRGDQGPPPTLDVEGAAWIAEEVAERAAASSEVEAMFGAPDIIIPEWAVPSGASLTYSGWL